MEIKEINSQIKEYSAQIEKQFLQLGEMFPALLNREGSTSLQSLQTMMRSLGDANTESAAHEKTLFNGYDDKYNPLFNQLNNKIEDLTTLNKMIAGIKEDSEQMELIALNAMVISIKSGEKGRAFSCITENLKRLSNDMFLFSDKLIDEEQQLVKNITSLKSIFSGILESQQTLSTQSASGSSSVEELMAKASVPLESMQKTTDDIYTPIRNAMEGMQLQDIIRQALDHVQLCLEEIEKNPTGLTSADDELDAVSFNISLMQLSEDVLKDIDSEITKSCSIFDSNWKTVTEELQSVQKEKTGFEQRFLDNAAPGPDNISICLANLINAFKKIIDEFGHYHLVQKDLLHTCQNITEKARTMYTVFGNLRPVMSRLHHVRILQQIEVSKNEAIGSVRDSVTDMDNLINSANDSLDKMQSLLESFITDTGHLLTTFTDSITKDNEQMNELRSEKNTLFTQLKSGQDSLSLILQNFTVFPTGFEEKCSTVQENLNGLHEVSTHFTQFIEELHTAELSAAEHKKQLMQQEKITSWEIRNTKFRELIDHFTITAHKEAAGKIGGFAIEKGAQSGDVTFF